jgi:hypothetical protein
MGQRQEPFGEQIGGPDVLGLHGGELFPGDSRRQFDPDAPLDRFAPGHGQSRHGAVRQVVTLFQQQALAFGHDRPDHLAQGQAGGEIEVLIAGQRSLSHGRGLGTGIRGRGHRSWCVVGGIVRGLAPGDHYQGQTRQPDPASRLSPSTEAILEVAHVRPPSREPGRD